MKQLSLGIVVGVQPRECTGRRLIMQPAVPKGRPRHDLLGPAPEPCTRPILALSTMISGQFS